MKKNTVVLVVVMAAVTFLCLACGDSSNPMSSETQLTVYMDSPCSGYSASPVDVYVDGNFWDTIYGYGTGHEVTHTIDSGYHTISAQGSNGIYWNSQTININSGSTFTFKLTCNSSKQGQGQGF
jgi:hypothetical protein